MQTPHRKTPGRKPSCCKAATLCHNVTWLWSIFWIISKKSSRNLRCVGGGSSGSFLTLFSCLCLYWYFRLTGVCFVEDLLRKLPLHLIFLQHIFYPSFQNSICGIVLLMQHCTTAGTTPSTEPFLPLGGCSCLDLLLQKVASTTTPVRVAPLTKQPPLATGDGGGRRGRPSRGARGSERQPPPPLVLPFSTSLNHKNADL